MVEYRFDGENTYALLYLWAVSDFVHEKYYISYLLIVYRPMFFACEQDKEQYLNYALYKLVQYHSIGGGGGGNVLFDGGGGGGADAPFEGGLAA